MNAYDAYDEINSSKPLIMITCLTLGLCLGYIIFSSPVKFFLSAMLKYLLKTPRTAISGKLWARGKVRRRERGSAGKYYTCVSVYLEPLLTGGYTYSEHFQSPNNDTQTTWVVCTESIETKSYQEENMAKLR